MEEEDRIQLVEDAAERAQLLETVRQMPNGFNTIIGDRSEENLSDGTNLCLRANAWPIFDITSETTLQRLCCRNTGQTQRLSLARGFLKDAEVMMMDEPTSALVCGHCLLTLHFSISYHRC